MTWLPVQTPAMARRFQLVVVALAALAWPAEVVAQGVKATVLSIGDGDTIRVRHLRWRARWPYPFAPVMPLAYEATRESLGGKTEPARNWTCRDYGGRSAQVSG